MSIVFIGCEAPRLTPLPEGQPAELEPGYASLPPVTNSRRLHGTPGCDRIEPRTSTSPAIEILSSGGVGGSGTGNVQIWEDGTVLFDGAGCPNNRRRRGKMSPARVRAVIDRLEQGGFFRLSCDEAVHCSDSFIVSLTVQRAGADHTVVDTGCSEKPTHAAQAIELVMKAVGKNACSPMCLTTPAPDYCH